MFHLRHDDRVKKGVPRRLNSYPFPLPLSLSCYRDRERVYFERDPSLRRKRAPSPPNDQGFCWGRASVRRRSHTKKQLRPKSFLRDGRRSLFMELRRFKPT
jgi:hypothetical protein